jgi:hypothetical protein
VSGRLVSPSAGPPGRGPARAGARKVVVQDSTYLVGFPAICRAVPIPITRVGDGAGRSLPRCLRPQCPASGERARSPAVNRLPVAGCGPVRAFGAECPRRPSLLREGPVIRRNREWPPLRAHPDKNPQPGIRDAVSGFLTVPLIHDREPKSPPPKATPRERARSPPGPPPAASRPRRPGQLPPARGLAARATARGLAARPTSRRPAASPPGPRLAASPPGPPPVGPRPRRPGHGSCLPGSAASPPGPPPAGPPARPGHGSCLPGSAASPSLQPHEAPKPPMPYTFERYRNDLGRFELNGRKGGL